MSAAVSYPQVEMENGSARLKRLPRIRVAQIVMDYLNNGWSADEICIHYPHLRLAEVHSAMAYYIDHQSEIEVEIIEEQKLIEDWRSNTPPSPFLLRLKAQGRLSQA